MSIGPLDGRFLDLGPSPGERGESAGRLLTLGQHEMASRQAVRALPDTSMEVYTPAMRQTRPASRSAQSRFVERRKAFRMAAMLPWALLVAGCGQKGPLYHPPEPDEEDKDEKTSAAPTAPDPRLG